MEEQSFLSTLPFRIKNRRRRTSVNTKVEANEQVVNLGNGEDRDADETSSDDEPGKPRRTDRATTPTGHTAATGFVGPSCGKDAPNVHYVNPMKQSLDVSSRPDLIDGSRYYFKRRIKIGNSSKFIPECMILLFKLF